MSKAISRAVMALAVNILGNQRRTWALAMQAEFEAARDDGRELMFALGCFLAACRELPRHEEGRFAIASHALALMLFVPVAAFLLSSVLTGFPGSYLGHAGGSGLLEISSEQGPLLNEANRSAVPSLLLIVSLLAGLNLRIAWLAVESDWARLTRVGALSAAATATLVIFSAVVFGDHSVALAQLAALVVQLSAAAALARWHGRLRCAASFYP
jgi:hypothetical protein